MSRKKPLPEPVPGPFNNAFAALKGVAGAPSPQAPAVAEPAPVVKGPAKAVIRMERKGRGGKEVTVVEQLELSLVQRQHWLKDLKGALGCGGALEGDVLVLQGDHRDRLKLLLTERGVRKVSVG